MKDLALGKDGKLPVTVGTFRHIPNTDHALIWPLFLILAHPPRLLTYLRNSLLDTSQTYLATEKR